MFVYKIYIYIFHILPGNVKKTLPGYSLSREKLVFLQVI